VCSAVLQHNFYFFEVVFVSSFICVHYGMKLMSCFFFLLIFMKVAIPKEYGITGCMCDFNHLVKPIN